MYTKPIHEDISFNHTKQILKNVVLLPLNVTNLYGSNILWPDVFRRIYPEPLDTDRDEIVGELGDAIADVKLGLVEVVHTKEVAVSEEYVFFFKFLGKKV